MSNPSILFRMFRNCSAIIAGGWNASSLRAVTLSAACSACSAIFPRIHARTHTRAHARTHPVLNIRWNNGTNRNNKPEIKYLTRSNPHQTGWNIAEHCGTTLCHGEKYPRTTGKTSTATRSKAAGTGRARMNTCATGPSSATGHGYHPAPCSLIPTKQGAGAPGITRGL